MKNLYKNPIIRRTLKLLVTFVVFFYIIKKFGIESIWQTVSHTNVIWLSAALTLFIVSIFLGAWQWYIILHNKKVP
jgi:hypothetical protein